MVTEHEQHLHVHFQAVHQMDHIVCEALGKFIPLLVYSVIHTPSERTGSISLAIVQVRGCIGASAQGFLLGIRVI